MEHHPQTQKSTYPCDVDFNVLMGYLRRLRVPKRWFLLLAWRPARNYKSPATAGFQLSFVPSMGLGCSVSGLITELWARHAITDSWLETSQWLTEILIHLSCPKRVLWGPSVTLCVRTGPQTKTAVWVSLEPPTVRKEEDVVSTPRATAFIRGRSLWRRGRHICQKGLESKTGL